MFNFPTQPKELVDKIHNDSTDGLSWEKVKKEVERLAIGNSWLLQRMPQVKEWFEMMQQDLGKPVNLPAHAEDLRNMSSSPQDFAA